MFFKGEKDFLWKAFKMFGNGAFMTYVQKKILCKTDDHKTIQNTQTNKQNMKSPTNHGKKFTLSS